MFQCRLQCIQFQSPDALWMTECNFEDPEDSDNELVEDRYLLSGVKLGTGRICQDWSEEKDKYL